MTEHGRPERFWPPQGLTVGRPDSYRVFAGPHHFLSSHIETLMGVRVTSIRPSLVACDPADVHAPASNTAAVVTYAAVADKAHAITGIMWSYSGGDPTGGNIKIEDGSGNTVFSLDITAKGPGFLPFEPAKKGTANTAMIVTLAAGGSGVSGKVSIPNHWSE